MTGPNAVRALPIAARIEAGSLASAANATAATPFAFSAATPASRRAWLRATSATEKPSAPNFSATAVEIPGPNPTITIDFAMALSDITPASYRRANPVRRRLSLVFPGVAMAYG